ncbi:MAG TPA: serine--tRNA ligase [Planctomycetota bacterium]|jgi:seryl-tRNA synthetase|nr:serine--tRNA ligase [Planctomycetota bacterium]MDP6129194.1 serine--tRNA ligase [Planctomycetota bacterium]HJM39599.1 serine--tRNA ligase [Planctomycetota bacterium]|tara:strand:- start:6945 stop:8225 length:1281 start_codon:yes stop_codon:yes gene_type:complete
MLDLKWVRENPEIVQDAARRKRIQVDVGALIDADAQHRALLAQVEQMRADLKASSKALGKLAPEEREVALAGQKEKKGNLKQLESEEGVLREKVQELALLLPMPPADDVPDGKDDLENLEIRNSGSVPELGFEPKSHVELGEYLGIVDIPRGVRIAGTRNYLLMGDGARLEQAVLQLSIDHMAKRGFELVSVPTLVKNEAMVGTGYFPGGEEQAYLCERDSLCLVGTSEVSLTSIHAGETLKASDLPLRRIAVSPCYRREAGTYGKDTKGLYRVHQFWKVEQVVIGPADEAWSREEHERMLGHATDLMDLLALPYRVVNVCTGDLGQGQVQKFDIETWMPSRGGYGETHSASRFHDFQSRRLNLRYRPEGAGKPQFCHTLNNTVVASPRVLIALLENYQQEDGSVLVPEALQPYMGTSKIQASAVL